MQREAKAEQPVLPKDEAVTKEEVDEFIKRYIRAYTQNDLEGFMSLFSRAAVENNTMDYQDIKNAYRETRRINQNIGDLWVLHESLQRSQSEDFMLDLHHQSITIGAAEWNRFRRNQVFKNAANFHSHSFHL